MPAAAPSPWLWAAVLLVAVVLAVNFVFFIMVWRSGSNKMKAPRSAPPPQSRNHLANPWQEEDDAWKKLSEEAEKLRRRS